MSAPIVLLVSVLGSLLLAAAGSYALHSALVLGGRTAEWLEANRWVYPAGFAAGSAIVVVGFSVPLWPLVPLGGAVAVVTSARYVWLNV